MLPTEFTELAGCQINKLNNTEWSEVYIPYNNTSLLIYNKKISKQNI